MINSSLFGQVSESGVSDDYDLGELPALGHFRKGALALYFGDLRQRDKVAEWVEDTTREKKKKVEEAKKRNNSTSSRKTKKAAAKKK